MCSIAWVWVACKLPCRRCRLRKILVCLEGREEVFENGSTIGWVEWEMGQSLRLKMLEMSDNNTDCASAGEKMNLYEWHTSESDYERWEQIFAGLGV
jgi:hypothetical protein